jgi:transcriptional regulator with XRE-family HTH domain
MVMRMERDSRPFPNRLRLFRKIAGLQQKQVARMLGFSTQITLSTWENEKFMPNGTNLMKLCIIYSTTPHDLYPEYHSMLKENLEYLTSIAQ